MTKTTVRLFKPSLAAIALATLAACGGGDDTPVATVTPPPPEPTRVQDTRAFTPADTPFLALSNSTVETDRWTGVLGGRLTGWKCPKPDGTASLSCGRTATRAPAPT